MNVWADKKAEQAMDAEEQPACYPQDERVRRTIAGGIWWVGGDSPQESVWQDNVMNIFSQYNKKRTIIEYWSRRRNSEGRAGLAAAASAWDSRVCKGIAGGGAVARKSIDFFWPDCGGIICRHQPL